MTASGDARSARILVIDTQQRILLLEERGATDRRTPTVWITPGGGVDEGEDVRSAACRELFEEVGIDAPPADLVGPLAVQGRGASDGVPIRDVFFALYTTPFDADLSRLTPFERDVIVGSRWWRLGELEATAETVLPPNLTELFAAAVERVPPPSQA